MKNRYKINYLPIIQNNWAIILAIMVGLMATFIAIFFVSQPLLEMHGFRQTQTALTSYWMLKDGWSLAYETPVAGFPWAIPMEFPIYQGIVSLIAYIFNLPLAPIGRLLSFCFLIACAWPAIIVTRKLKLKPQVAWVFCALLWSSPIYLFWGRTFMIETAALFFTLAAIPYAIDFFDVAPSLKSAFLFSLFATIGLLQKVTTAAPVLLVLAILTVIIHFQSFGFRLPTWKKITIIAFAFLIPFVLVSLWTNYTDSIKALNPLDLTSIRLNKTYFGTLKQHLNFNVLKTIFWDRVISKNVAGIFGIIILCLSLCIADRRIRSIILICLILFFLPIYSFLNVHLMHNYYQVSSTVFIISAIAVATSQVFPERIRKIPFSSTITILLVGANFISLEKPYAGALFKTFDTSTSNILAVAEVIQMYTPEESAVVIFGDNWSSEIGYYSERKSFTVPNWYKGYNAVWHNPSNYIGKQKLGALVFCTNGEIKINLTDILNRPDVKSDSSLFKIKESYIWLPGAKSLFLPWNNRTILPMEFYEKLLPSIPSGYTETKSSNCDGSIDIINGIFPAPKQTEVSGFITVDGWMAFSAKDGIAAEEIFITLKNSDGLLKYFTTQSKPRRDVNHYYNKLLMADVGFISSINVNDFKGDYVLGAAIGYKGQLIHCRHINIPVKISGAKE